MREKYVNQLLAILSKEKRDELHNFYNKNEQLIRSFKRINEYLSNIAKGFVDVDIDVIDKILEKKESYIKSMNYIQDTEKQAKADKSILKEFEKALEEAFQSKNIEELLKNKDIIFQWQEKEKTIKNKLSYIKNFIKEYECFLNQFSLIKDTLNTVVKTLNPLEIEKYFLLINNFEDTVKKLGELLDYTKSKTIIINSTKFVLNEKTTIYLEDLSNYKGKLENSIKQETEAREVINKIDNCLNENQDILKLIGNLRNELSAYKIPSNIDEVRKIGSKLQFIGQELTYFRNNIKGIPKVDLIINDELSDIYDSLSTEVNMTNISNINSKISSLLGSEANLHRDPDILRRAYAIKNAKQKNNRI